MNRTRALGMSIVLVLAALSFDAFIGWGQGRQKALEFFTGYLIELLLSIDNLFVFFLIFSSFKVEAKQQARILSWGVLGAQLMRAVFILCGVALLKAFSWIVYVFGLLLIVSGIKLFVHKNRAVDFTQNPLIYALKHFKGLSVFALVLITVELVDVIFALDSIPAVLAVTKDPFIVYSSNIFAILGLRSMYFVLSPVIEKLEFLHYLLGAILLFVGGKMVLDPVWPMPIGLALGFIVVLLAGFIYFTYRKRKGAL